MSLRRRPKFISLERAASDARGAGSRKIQREPDTDERAEVEAQAASRQDPIPILGGILLEREQGGAEIMHQGHRSGPLEDRILQGAVRYLLESAVDRGILDSAKRRAVDDGELLFEAGQIFFEHGKIAEIRLELASIDGLERYGTDRRPLIEQGDQLQLDPRDESRFHLSALVLDEQDDEPTLGLVWNLEPDADGGQHILTPERLMSAAAASSMYIPVNPPLRATLEAIYSAGRAHRWTQDAYGRPLFTHEARDGLVRVFFDFDFEQVPEETAIGALMMAVSDLSVETGDVFLILMSRIAELQDPSRDLAQIRLEEIADYRAVRLRRGHRSVLLEELYEEVLRLADLRLSMQWKDYADGGTIRFGEEKPDRLFDIVDVSYERNGRKLKGISFRCGQALAYFLKRDSLRWVGRYSRALLELNPRQEGFTKKIGTYWAINGVIAGKNGRAPVATARSILDFCGEPPNERNPNRTVDRMIEAHQRLREIGLLEDTPDFEPPRRQRGYFQTWLDEPRRVTLSRDLWQIMRAGEKARLPSDRRPPVVSGGKQVQRVLPLGIPATEQEIVENPLLIGLFRRKYSLRQEDLASKLDLSRKSVGRYEQGKRTVPTEVAIKILELWRRLA